MKKIEKLLIISVILLLTLLFLKIGMFIYNIEFKPAVITTIYNENNNYKVVFKSIGEPAWPFGPEKVKVILYDEYDKKINSYNTKIFNDGGKSDQGDIIVIWLDDRARIILSGEEQKDEIIEIKYDSNNMITIS